MAGYKLKIQRFRTNDLIDNGGKQFEMGKSWCEDFFGINTDVKERTLFLTFRPLNNSHKSLDGTKIELWLSEVNVRGDRKAYANAETGGNSQIKDFFINKLHLTVENNLSDYFAFYKLDTDSYLLFYVPKLLYDNFIQLFKAEIPPFNVENKVAKIDIDYSIQQIFYGAPGTGKSHAVKTETEAWEKRGRVVRTTFHPDSDYSTFVGAYKPTTESVQRYDIYNKPMTRDGVPVMEQIITYEFVEQAFLQAYIDAWKNRDEPEFLIIEEINRGNCAQIFGDLFQLLDRGNDGYSEYAIKADKDLQKHLCKAFEDVEIADYPNVKTGKELLLPGNLYIRATMNTSDQSLFPIDSAFKRRWDWKYAPITKGNDNGTELNWMIEVDGNQYDWWTFVRTINKHVFDTTNSEDKQLGFFFCKAMDNIISAETFVCKVIFYLWNDVFKDFGFDDKIFEDKEDNENPKLSFDKFYMANGKVNSEKIKIFLSNLGINTSTDRNEDNENGDGDMSTKVSFIINGNKVRYINQVCHTAIEEYVKSNKALAVQDIIDYWSEYTQYNQSSWIIGNQTKYESLSEADKKKTYSIRTDNNESLWVNKNGWVYQDGPGDIRKFIKAVNDAEIGIKIEENRE